VYKCVIIVDYKVIIISLQSIGKWPSRVHLLITQDNHIPGKVLELMMGRGNAMETVGSGKET